LERVANLVMHVLTSNHGLFAGEHYDYRAACPPTQWVKYVCRRTPKAKSLLRGG
jgi:hypothetical protein